MSATVPLPGRLLKQEGAAVLHDLYPVPATRAEAAPRIMARARALIDSSDERKWPIGFFLFGLAEAAGGRHA
jgi:hypothetical protein